MENNVAKIKVNRWMLALTMLLLLPSYYYVAGMNLAYLYPIILLLLYAVNKRLRLIVPRGTGNSLFWLFLIYLTLVAFVQRGVLYGLVTGISTLGILYLVLASITSKQKLFQLLDAIIIIVFFSCVMGIFEAITSINIFQIFSNSGLSFFTDFRMGHIRIMAQFAQPIVYGFYLLLVSPLVVYRIVTAESKAKERFVKLTYILMWINVILTASRAAIAAFLILQLVYLFKLGHSKVVFRIAGFCTIFCIVILIDGIFNLGIGNKINQFLGMFAAIIGFSSTETYTGVGNRFEIFDWVLETVGNNLWFGNGIDDKFAYKVHEWQIKESIENEYLNTFFHYGIVGVIFECTAFIGNLAYCFKLQRRIRRKENVFNLINAIYWCLLAFYIVIFTAGQSNAITAHIYMIAIVMAYGRLYDRGLLE